MIIGFKRKNTETHWREGKNLRCLSGDSLTSRQQRRDGHAGVTEGPKEGEGGGWQFCLGEGKGVAGSADLDVLHV